MVGVGSKKNNQLWNELCDKHIKEKPILEFWYKHLELWGKVMFLVLSPLPLCLFV